MSNITLGSGVVARKLHYAYGNLVKEHPNGLTSLDSSLYSAKLDAQRLQFVAVADYNDALVDKLTRMRNLLAQARDLAKELCSTPAPKESVGKRLGANPDLAILPGVLENITAACNKGLDNVARLDANKYNRETVSLLEIYSTTAKIGDQISSAMQEMGTATMERTVGLLRRVRRLMKAYADSAEVLISMTKSVGDEHPELNISMDDVEAERQFMAKCAADIKGVC